MLRPEDIQIDAGDGFLKGVICDVVFLGEVVRYVVELPGGRRLTANTSGAFGLHETGAEVLLSWTPERIWIVPDGAADA